MARGVRLELAPDDLGAEEQFKTFRQVLADPTKLAEIATDAEKHFAPHSARVASVHTNVAEHRRTKEAEAYAASASDRTLRAMLGRSIETAVGNYRRERVASSDSYRAEPLRELHRLDGMAQQLEPLFASPKVLATRWASGSEERARYAAEYARAGVASLGTIAREILATGNKVAAAAFVAHVDSLKREDRPREIDTTALAAAVFGEDHSRFAAVLATAKERYAQAIDAERRLVSGRSNSAAKIQLGLNQRRAEQK